MTDAIMVLERALNVAGQSCVSPLQVFAWLANSEPHNARVPLPPGHSEALLATQRVAGTNLVVWWNSGKRTPAEVAKLFEDAIFEIQMGAL